MKNILRIILLVIITAAATLVLNHFLGKNDGVSQAEKAKYQSRIDSLNVLLSVGEDSLAAIRQRIQLREQKLQTLNDQVNRQKTTITQLEKGRFIYDLPADSLLNELNILCKLALVKDSSATDSLSR